MKSYLDLLLTERYWSWAFVGMDYLIFTLIVRSLIFAKVVRGTKELEPQLYSSVKKLYQENSLGGWSLFLISFLLVIVAWLGWPGPLELAGAQRALLFILLSALLPTLFLFSIILHLKAYIKALLTVLRQKMGVEREF